MRVGINVFPFSSTSTSGHNPYTRDLIAALVSLHPQDSFFILTSVENNDYFAHAASNCQTICIYDVLPIDRRADPYAVSSNGDADVQRHCDLYDCIDSLALDALLCPWIDANWDRIKVPSVVIIADILQEYHPEVLSDEENAWRYHMFRQACRSATQVMCISEFTGKTVIERFGAQKQKVHAVPSAISKSFTHEQAQRSWSMVQEQFGLQRGYLFLPATTWAHKNHLRLIAALGLLKQSGVTPHLVLTGGHKMPLEQLMSAVAEVGCQDQVTHLGFVDQAYMPGLYHGAACLVFPSVFEGFGLPALEALSIGCPLICSDIEVFREVVGDAAIMFDPLDPVDIARAIKHLVATPEQAEDLRSRGFLRAAEFTWEKVGSAARTILAQAADLSENRALEPFVQGIYPDDWAGPHCFIKRINRSRWRELFIEGDNPAGCNNATIAVLCNGVCLSALHSQEPTRFSYRIVLPQADDGKPFVDVEILVDRDIVPRDLELSADRRRLSFVLRSLVLFDAEGNAEVLRGSLDR